MTRVAMEQTPPILHVPSEKEKKYDRQLRLWAADGQVALEEAHVLLLNSGAGTVGTETLKNLVLPGIGNFTIVDDTVVTKADLGVNFFLDERSLGKLRSKCCTELLQELNPDVKGAFIGTNDVFRSEGHYSFIIYTHPIDPELLVAVEEYSQRQQIPSISISAAGFYSYFRVQLPGSFPIVDTHPDSTFVTDLRLLSPWPEFSAFVSELTANIKDLDSHAHGHIPYAVLLLHYLEEWKTIHGDKTPKTFAEKISFRQMVTEGARKNNSEGGEENYDEAAAAVLKSILEPKLSSSVSEVFTYTPNENESKSSFWIITEAVKKFYDQNKTLPLPGSVPDMKAQSDVYVRLQNIFKAKARQDVTEVRNFVEMNSRGDSVDMQDIEKYCKNATFVKLIRRIEPNSINLKNLVDAELNAELAITPTLIPIYLALKARETAITPTKDEFLSEISKEVGNMAGDERVMQAVQEVIRAKGGELHNISALTGGMVAQEVIKIITKQYVPIDNTCIFDGITSRTQILKL